MKVYYIIVTLITLSFQLNADSVKIHSDETGAEYEISIDDLSQLIFKNIQGGIRNRVTLDNLNLEVNRYSDESKISPGFYLSKYSTVGFAGMGLAKIQWRMTNAIGQQDIDAGRISAIINNAEAGNETVTMSICPQIFGNEEALAAMSWQNGVVVPDGVTPVFFRGLGTANLSKGLYIADKRVLGPRDHGWTYCSGYNNKGGWDSENVTFEELARTVKTLTNALIDHGLIGE